MLDLDMMVSRLDSLGVENAHIKGSEIRSCCPLHEGENVTSFSVSENGKSFCFACEKGFHSFDGLIKHLSEKAGVPFESFEMSVDHLFDFLEDSHEMPVEPMVKAGIDRFKVDYDHFVREWGISREVAERHRLRINPQNGHECYPIVDHRGDFWGFVERYKGPNRKGPNRSIYRYPKNIKKGKILLGEGEIEEEGYRGNVWVVEGIRDLCAIETKIEGSRALALGGARLSDDQARYLGRFDRVICATDNDDAGIRVLMQFEKKIPPSRLMFAQYGGKDPASKEATNFRLRHPVFGLWK
jgi:DNA primase